MYTGELDPASNRADWRVTIEVSDPSTGAVIDITGSEIKIAVRHSKKCSPNWDAWSTSPSILSADETDGHIVIDGPLGKFTFTFPLSEMVNVNSGQYDVGMTIKISGTTHQLLIGTVSILDGVVSR